MSQRHPPNPMMNLFRTRRTRDHQLPATCPARVLRARVMFVTFYRDGVIIDLMAQPDGASPESTPIALDALLTNAPWAYAAAVALEEWVSTSADVELELRHPGGYSKVVLSDRTYRMVLDLHRDPAGLASGEREADPRSRPPLRAAR